MRSGRYNNLNGIPVRLEDDQLKKIETLVYVMAGALVLSALIKSRAKTTK